MSHRKPATLITLTLATVATLAATAGTAAAGDVEDATQTWCKPRGTTDQILVTSESAALVWRADGNLALEPLNHIADQIWSTDTAGTGAQVCWGARGALSVKSASGATLWHQPAPALPNITAPALYKYRATPALDGCTLSADYRIAAAPLCVFPGACISFPSDEGHAWSRPATCPVVSEHAVSDGWCLDTSQDRLLLQNPWAELTWQANGNLVLRARGIRAGQLVWASNTGGRGKQACFDPRGTLTVSDGAGSVLWQTPDTGTTATSHMLGLDQCDLSIKPLDGSAAQWERPARCPQTLLNHLTDRPQATTDTVLIENDRAQLVFDTTGNLILRARTGDLFWTSDLAPGTGRRLAFQPDGNLVIYAGGTPLWATNAYNQGVQTMVLDGCKLSLLAPSGLKWTRGPLDCALTTVDNHPAWTMSNQGEATLLRAPESHLDWQADGNLVLYTTRGTAVWSTGTYGRGKKLGFRGDGVIEIFDGNGVRLWGTPFTPGFERAELVLGDHCELSLRYFIGGNQRSFPINRECAVARHSFQRTDGDGNFGATLRTDVAALDDATGQRVHSQTSIDVSILGNRRALLSASAWQQDGHDGADTASVIVAGHAAVAGTISATPITFFEFSRTFMVGPVPVEVNAGATGELGLELAFHDGQLDLQPSAGVYATVSAGIGGGCDVIGASAGIRGSVTIIELALPMSLKVYLVDGQPRFTMTGDLELDSLSGAFELYAEGHIGYGPVSVSVDWSRELFGWTGISWSKHLFTKTGSF